VADGWRERFHRTWCSEVCRCRFSEDDVFRSDEARLLFLWDDHIRWILKEKLRSSRVKGRGRFLACCWFWGDRWRRLRRGDLEGLFFNSYLSNLPLAVAAAAIPTCGIPVITALPMLAVIDDTVPAARALTR
jgi:hypothetical protein